MNNYSTIPIKCACGCGEYTSKMWRKWTKKNWVKGSYYKYVHGHNSEGKKLTQFQKTRLREGWDNKFKNNKEFRDILKNNLSKAPKGHTFTEEQKKRIKESNIKFFKTHPEEIKNRRARRLKQVFPTKDTSIEVKLQKMLMSNNIEFETHKPIMGQPDIFIKPNICIFADGMYWHSKDGVKERDIRVNEKLSNKGYLVLRFSDVEIDNCFVDVTNTIMQDIANKKLLMIEGGNK